MVGSGVLQDGEDGKREGGLEYVYYAVGQMVEIIWVGDLKGGG